MKLWKKKVNFVSVTLAGASKCAMTKNSSALEGVCVDPLKQFKHSK